MKNTQTKLAASTRDQTIWFDSVFSTLFKHRNQKAHNFFDFSQIQLDADRKFGFRIPQSNIYINNQHRMCKLFVYKHS